MHEAMGMKIGNGDEIIYFANLVGSRICEHL